MKITETKPSFQKAYVHSNAKNLRWYKKTKPFLIDYGKNYNIWISTEPKHFFFKKAIITVETLPDREIKEVFAISTECRAKASKIKATIKECAENVKIMKSRKINDLINKALKENPQQLQALKDLIEKFQKAMELEL